MTSPHAEALFSMLEGFSPVTNLLGAGDPNVQWIGDSWWMFFGGFQPTFRNNIFAASLEPGEPLREGMRWRICTEQNRPHRALPLVPQPRRGQWDHYGLHEPSFAQRSPADDGASGPAPAQRIYYAGRGSRSVLGNDNPYAIGMLELTPTGWRRHPTPVVSGSAELPSALGPKVIYADGKWRMWFRATTGEPAKGEQPVTEIHYTESMDGITGWTTPTVLYSRHDGFAHAFVRQTGTGFEMLLSKSPNLYGQEGYPEQTLWISTATRPSGAPRDWSEPRPVLEAAGGPAWYRGGFFGSSLCEPHGVPAEPGPAAARANAGNGHPVSRASENRPGRSRAGSAERVVFFTGAHAPINWPRAALRHLGRWQRPPVPAPYYFTIGAVRVDLPSIG